MVQLLSRATQSIAITLKAANIHLGPDTKKPLRQGESMGPALLKPDTISSRGTPFIRLDAVLTIIIGISLLLLLGSHIISHVANPMDAFEFPRLEETRRDGTLPQPLTLKATVVDTTKPDSKEQPIPINFTQPKKAPKGQAMVPPPPFDSGASAPPQGQAGGPGKVPYEKGYSQMDWLRRHSAEEFDALHLRDDITLEEVGRHNKAEDAWMVLRGKVYNITPYLKFHPGGEKILRSVYGKDGTAAFEKYHRWVNAPALIGRLAVGRLAQPAEAGKGKRASSEDGES